MFLVVDVVYQPLIDLHTHTSLYAQCKVQGARSLSVCSPASCQDFKITSQELNINFTVDQSTQFPSVDDTDQAVQDYSDYQYSDYHDSNSVNFPSAPVTGPPSAPSRPPSPVGPPSPPGDYGGVSPPAPVAPSQSQTPANTQTQTDSASQAKTGGLDVTLLVFIIIIAVLMVGLIIILLVYWCCRPTRQEEAQQREQIISIEKSAGQLDKELTRAGLGLAAVEKTVARLEANMETGEAGQLDSQRAQALLGAEQLRLKEESRKISQTVETLQDKIRKV